MLRSPILTRRKTQMENPKETTSASQSTPREPEQALETTASSALTTTLQALLKEIRQLREEQQLARAEWAEAMRRQDAETRRRQELHDAQLSLSNNTNITVSANHRGVASLPVDNHDIARLAGGDESVVDGRRAAVNDRAESCSSSRAAVKLKPDTFDGSSSLREFLAQFNLIARVNGWGVETKTAVLVSCLRGKARAVLENVQNLENLDFSELKSKLELRFGEAQSLQNYYSQFTNRKQKFGENIASLGTDIERLSQLAYPECSDSVRDKIACAQFVSALSNGFIKRALQMEGVTSLRTAIERGKAIKLIQEESFQYKREDNFNFEKKNKNNGSTEKKEKNQESTNKKREGDKLSENKFEKFTKKRNGEKNGYKENKECWECGKKGHFRSECPGKAGNQE